jgi:hypothetical protein
MPDADIMACFRVLIHGRFERLLGVAQAHAEPRGFYTTRWVTADTKPEAVSKAFELARRELHQKLPDVRDGFVVVEMDAEETTGGSWWRWLKGGGRGFSFYTGE